jgi:hypothetical protein
LKVWKTGSCHCGKVQFRVRSEFAEALDCDCSICRKKGYLHLIVPAEDFELIQGQDALNCYSFNTGVAKHLFCTACGISPYYIPRSHPDGFDVNLRCIDELELDSVRVTPFLGSKWEENIGSIEGYS